MLCLLLSHPGALVTECLSPSNRSLFPAAAEKEAGKSSPVRAASAIILRSSSSMTKSPDDQLCQLQDAYEKTRRKEEARRADELKPPVRSDIPLFRRGPAPKEYRLKVSLIVSLLHLLAGLASPRPCHMTISSCFTLIALSQHRRTVGTPPRQRLQ